MQKISRRKFFGESLTVAAGMVALGSIHNSFCSEPDLRFPTQPRERLGVASWPFRAFIESPTNMERNRKEPGMDLKDFAAMVVKRFDVRNIEPLGDHFRSTDDTYLGEFREAVEKAGAHIINLPVGVRASFYDPNPAKRRLAVENGKKWVDVAVALGSPNIRTGIKDVYKSSPDVDRAAESLSQLAAYGAQKNIIVNLENDNLVSEDAFFIVKIIEKVNNPNLRALPDFCNTMLTGNPEYNYDGVTAMFKHAYSICHVKDSEKDDKGRLFTVDVGRTFGIAKASGYRGYFSMEWEGVGGPYEGTQKLIDLSLKYLA